MHFDEAARTDAVFTRTENGAAALKTTGDARLDFFSVAGSLRTAEEARITRLFFEAWKMDPLFATKIAFYARDVRGGLGERQTFRTLLKFMAEYHPEALCLNLDLVGVYGRYDDLYSLIGTSMEDEMWAAMKKQFEEDREPEGRQRRFAFGKVDQDCGRFFGDYPQAWNSDRAEAWILRLRIQAPGPCYEKANRYRGGTDICRALG